MTFKINDKMCEGLSFSSLAKPNHIHCARAVCFALNQHAESAWWELAFILSARLSYEEQIGLCYATILSLHSEAAHIIVKAALEDLARGEAA